MTVQGGFIIKRFIVIAALLLITGCSSNNLANKGQPPVQTKVETHSRNAARTSTLTQASSISTPNAGKTSVKIKQAPNDASNWMDYSNQAADTSQFTQQVLNLVNEQRTKSGLQSLRMNSSLSNMAMVKAQDMFSKNYFDHQSPTYGSPFDMMNAFGITYSSAGENIAKGQTSPTEVMNQWMNSPGHRANILNSSFTQIGIAYYNGEWVQEFIG